MQIIFHIDVNSAYLSWSAVERLKKDPSLDLRTVPSIIGGDEKSRHGIVLAKSIPAKKYGIHTAEPVASALRKCPTLIMEPPDHKLYSRRSHELMDLLHTYTSDIEQVSVDECYLLYSPIAHLFPSTAEGARAIADRIRDELGFTVNVGIAPNKLLAKMASDFEKPDRVHTLFPQEIPAKMWPLPVGDLYMVGQSSAHRLQELGIRTIGELAHTDITFLQQHFKKHGKMMWEFANGIDDSPLNSDSRDAKGTGNSTTLSSDLTRAEQAHHVLLSLAEQVARRLRRAHQLAQTVTVEIKYNTFQSCSRQTQLSIPTAASSSLHQYGCRLFDELWNGAPIRLLGLRTSKLLPEDAPVQLSLFDSGLLEEAPPLEHPHPSGLKHAGNAPGPDIPAMSPGFPGAAAITDAPSDAPSDPPDGAICPAVLSSVLPDNVVIKDHTREKQPKQGKRTVEEKQGPEHYTTEKDRQDPKHYTAEKEKQDLEHYTIEKERQGPEHYTTEKDRQDPEHYTTEKERQDPKHHTTKKERLTPGHYTAEKERQRLNLYTDEEKKRRLEQAMDQIRNRYGQEAVIRGSFLKTPANSKTAARREISLKTPTDIDSHDTGLLP